MPKLKSWGIRKVQGLLSKVAFDPSTDQEWQVVGEGVSDDYFIGRAITEIKLLSTTSDKLHHFEKAVKFLVMYYCRTHLDG